MTKDLTLLKLGHFHPNLQSRLEIRKAITCILPKCFFWVQKLLILCHYALEWVIKYKKLDFCCLDWNLFGEHTEGSALLQHLEMTAVQQQIIKCSLQCKGDFPLNRQMSEAESNRDSTLEKEIKKLQCIACKDQVHQSLGYQKVWIYPPSVVIKVSQNNLCQHSVQVLCCPLEIFKMKIVCGF